MTSKIPDSPTDDKQLNYIANSKTNMIQNDNKPESKTDNKDKWKANEEFQKNLNNARGFYQIEQWQAASRYYYKASKYVDSDQQKLISDLELAKNLYEHGAFKEAAVKYEKFFSSLSTSFQRQDIP